MTTCIACGKEIVTDDDLLVTPGNDPICEACDKIRYHAPLGVFHTDRPPQDQPFIQERAGDAFSAIQERFDDAFSSINLDRCRWDGPLLRDVEEYRNIEVYPRGHPFCGVRITIRVTGPDELQDTLAASARRLLDGVMPVVIEQAKKAVKQFQEAEWRKAMGYEPHG